MSEPRTEGQGGGSGHTDCGTEHPSQGTVVQRASGGEGLGEVTTLPCHGCQKRCVSGERGSQKRALFFVFFFLSLDFPRVVLRYS